VTEPPFKLLGLDHLLLHVQGMAEAERFYCGVLGCDVKHRLPGDAMIELSAGIVLVDTADPNGAWALEGTQPGRNVDHFALATGPSDRAATRKWLADNGVEIERERGEDGEVSLYVSDPSGNRIELVRRS
jgi:catechol 2,3-dioxygenase-like lactoylglutathione lyase family enzyme